MRFSLFERIDTESGLYAVICDGTLNWPNTFTFQAHKWHYSGVIKASHLAFTPLLWVTTDPEVQRFASSLSQGAILRDDPSESW